nr:lytic murein transglycosylase [Candidatus Kapabacteria bacterium]
GLLFATALFIFFFAGFKLEADTFDKDLMFAPLFAQAAEAGIDSVFLQKLIDHPGTSFKMKYVKINVSGFLKKPDYSHNYNANAVNKSMKFYTENFDLLDSAEKKYSVPKEVITSIIWVETRHGGYLGKHHIPSVYLSTATANDPDHVEFNKNVLRDGFKGSKAKLKKLETKIEKRAARKAKWAMKQLKALQEIDQDSSRNIFDIKGSWAGAFGLSQFLPTSYLSYAVDGDGDSDIDLFSVPDAIFSVANYLKSNGWRKSKTSHKKAVFHYNNSKAYVGAVLKLAEKIEAEAVEK